MEKIVAGETVPMIPYSRMLASALALVICTSGLVLAEIRSAQAAEIECIHKLNGSYPEDVASKWWPSGFRPTADMCSRGFLHGIIVKGDYVLVLATNRK